MSDDVRFVDFFGEKFAVPQRINQRLIIRFGRLAAEGADTEDLDPAKADQAAIMLDRMLDQMVRPEDKDRFEDLCDRERPTDEELMKLLADVMAATTGRPTSRPSDSSAGPPTTNGSSAVDSSSQVITQLEERGRPDLALIVSMAQEESRASA